MDAFGLMDIEATDALILGVGPYKAAFPIAYCYSSVAFMKDIKDILQKKQFR